MAQPTDLSGTRVEDKESVVPVSEGNIYTGEDIAARAHEAFVEKMKNRDVLAFDTQPMTTSQWLKECLKDTIKLREAPQRLHDVSFEGIAKFLADRKCSNVITMAGAGISTSAGIPDYRSPGTGLFHAVKDEVSDVTDIFDVEYFKKNPKLFFERSKRFFEISPKPTPCHYFLRLLHEKGCLLRHYTQNIDMLERLVGLPGDKVVEAHGTFYTSHCMDCHHGYNVRWMKDRILKDQIPRCEKNGCKGVVKPDIVMYGEPLSPRFAECVEKDFPVCDLLIILGTSLVVQPFASLISKVKIWTPRLYINLDNGGMDKNNVGVVFGGGLYFDVPGNLTDVFKQATCDDACLELADLAGWGKELRSLIPSEQQRTNHHKAATTRTTTKGITTTTATSPRKPKNQASSTFARPKHDHTTTTTTTAAAAAVAAARTQKSTQPPNLASPRKQTLAKK